jgi:hypothetical protein
MGGKKDYVHNDTEIENTLAPHGKTQDYFLWMSLHTFAGGKRHAVSPKWQAVLISPRNIVPFRDPAQSHRDATQSTLMLATSAISRYG